MIGRASLVLLVAFGLSACSTKLPPAGVKAFHRCDYDRAIEVFAQKQPKKKDALLFDLGVLSAAVYKGDNDLVKKVGARAQDRMWSYDGKGKGTASLISSEAIRIYKGEPFEKSMVSIYLGITYFNEGDYENARAAFTKAMFAVQTKNEKKPPDFVAPYIFLAKTYLKLGDSDNARIVLSKLDKVLPKEALQLEPIKKIKTIFFVEIGRGPIKYRTGPGGSLIGYQRQRYARRPIDIRLNGNSVSMQATYEDDLTYQAQTIDRRGKTAVQATKGVLREAAGVTAVIAASEAANRKNKTAGWVALGAGIFAAANQSQADIRQWELLPDLLQTNLSLEPVTEGDHQFSATYSGRNQNALSSDVQVWYDKRVPGQDQIYIVRPMSCSVP